MRILHPKMTAADVRAYRFTTEDNAAMDYYRQKSAPWPPPLWVEQLFMIEILQSGIDANEIIYQGDYDRFLRDLKELEIQGG